MLAQKAIRFMKLLRYKLDYGHKSQGTCVAMYPVITNTSYCHGCLLIDLALGRKET